MCYCNITKEISTFSFGGRNPALQNWLLLFLFIFPNIYSLALAFTFEVQKLFLFSFHSKVYFAFQKLRTPVCFYSALGSFP